MCFRLCLRMSAWLCTCVCRQPRGFVRRVHRHDVIVVHWPLCSGLRVSRGVRQQYCRAVSDGAMELRWSVDVHRLWPGILRLCAQFNDVDVQWILRRRPLRQRDGFDVQFVRWAVPRGLRLLCRHGGSLQGRVWPRPVRSSRVRRLQLLPTGTVRRDTRAAVVPVQWAV